MEPEVTLFMTEDRWKSLHHFVPEEFSHPERMSYKLLVLLDSARELAGVPFEISSAYRMEDEGSHGSGMAVDLKCSDSSLRFQIVQAALEAGFRRIGIYDRHVHLDVAPSSEKSQFVLWTGRSR